MGKARAMCPMVTRCGARLCPFSKRRRGTDGHAPYPLPIISEHSTLDYSILPVVAAAMGGEFGIAEARRSSAR
jgi:hypothetical protein